MDQDTTPAVNKAKVLIVEDELSIAKALQIKMRREDVTADIVYNGTEALAALKSHQYQVLLLDLMVPEPDGFSILETISTDMTYHRPHVIAVTSNLSQDEDKEKVKKYGVSDYFVKSNTSLGNLIDWVKSNT